MLTVEERRFVADHLRATSRYAAVYVTALGVSFIGGAVLGTGLHVLNQLVHRRPFSLFGG